MRLWLSMLVVLIVLLAAPFTAAGQGAAALENLQIMIWPEFDQPGVLVIYRMELASSMELPAQVSLRIPSSAAQPHAVAMEDVDGSLVTISYSTAQDGDWTVVKFSTPGPNVQLEYYDPNLQKEGTQRRFAYTWPGDMGVNNAAVQVQQPAAATEMQIVPNMGSGRVNDDGLTYYESVIGDLAAGTPLTLEIAYQKTDDSLSRTSQSVGVVDGVDSSTPGRTTFQEVLPWVLGGLGLILIAGGGLWYWQSDRDRSSAGARNRHTPARPRSEAAEEGASAAAYCHQCGKRTSPGDVFCRTCGTRLRQ